jgi:hypothetical protein
MRFRDRPLRPLPRHCPGSRIRFLCVALVLGALAPAASSARQQDWETRAERHANRLIEKNGQGTDPALKQELLQMYKDDQAVRARLTSAPPAQRVQATNQMEDVDSRVTARLKQIVAAKGWPTIALVGPEASQAAAVMLTHSADHKWQAALLPQLRKLVADDQIFGSDIAGLTDRILVSQGKLQLFGTQFKEQGGRMIMVPVKDPQHLEQRRAQYLLPPMAEYRKTLRAIYHLPVE